jgi:hypothetical protein
LQFPWFLLIVLLLVDSLKAMTVAPEIHCTFVGHGVIWNLWVLAWCEPYG